VTDAATAFSIANYLGGDLTPLYEAIDSVAKDVAITLSPTLLLIAIFTRTMETQLDGLVGGGKWAAALRDMTGWGVVLGLYAAIGYYVVDLFNAIYVWADGKGSLARLLSEYGSIADKMNARFDNASAGSTILNWSFSLPAAVAGLAYYLTRILADFVYIFLKVANVLVYGVAYIWGLIAIPMSISTSFRILRGWGLLLGLSLVWPLVQALLLAIFITLFANAGNIIANDTSLNDSLATASLYSLFAVLNLLLIAVLVAAPFIANALVANAPAAAGIVTPFVGAALAAGAGFARATEKSTGAIKNVATQTMANSVPAAGRLAGRMGRVVSPKKGWGLQDRAGDSGSGAEAAPVGASASAVADTGGIKEKLRAQKDRKNAIIRQNQPKRR
jgi:hypothetical protein